MISSHFSVESVLGILDNLEFFIRILLAGIMGAVIGLERSGRKKEAGIRTHIIIAITSAVFMILSKYAFLDMDDFSGTLGAKGADPSRIASQVVSGISFLCAGVIFRQGKFNIQGLTTAAGMWATASVGMAIGAGMYWMGVLETLLLLVMQIVLHVHPVGNDALHIQEIRLKVTDEAHLEVVLDRLRKQHGGDIMQCDVSREPNGIRVKVTMRAVDAIKADEAIDMILMDKDIKELSV